MRYKSVFLLLLPVLLFLVAVNLCVGSVNIPLAEVWRILTGQNEGESTWSYIVLESRLPQTITALLCGASLSVAGLLLQTTFRNPLAGPSILGIDAGANLGVAVATLLWGGSLVAGNITLSGSLLILVAALLGSFAVMLLLLFFSSLLQQRVMLLITGVMISYLTSSCISLLNYLATEGGVHSFLIWGMGSFGGVSMAKMPLFATLLVVALFVALLLVKPLNGLLLGDRYAANIGISIRSTHRCILLVTGVLVSVCTAFCGPIAFIGLAVPHLARMLFRTSDHRILMPATILVGGILTLFCSFVSTLPGETGIIPINVITPILGAPVILYVILHRR